ncbi:MAG: hypothetical protein SF053_21750 [Bacteroidia bacterium]|nr:hypothetical protein [Bacteroidia bacterium]
MWVQIWAQEPDFALRECYPAGRAKTLNLRPGVSASMELYSNGQSLSMVVWVKDADIRQHSQTAYADHVEVWFALPPSAYPEDFEYALHPSYMYAASTTRSAAPASPPRTFSAYSEYTPRVSSRSFLQDFDYPSTDKITRDSLQVPSPSQLRKEDIHFGIVQFALFPDGRKAVQLNRRNHESLERTMSLSMGNPVDGIRYDAVYMEDGSGYIINAEFSLKALGFIQLPELRQLRLMVDIANSLSAGEKAEVLLSSSPYREAGSPATFNAVTLRRPLYTNVTDIPTHIFTQTHYYPILMTGAGADDWFVAGVDVDALVYKPQYASQKLTEVKFFRQYHTYEAGNWQGMPYEILQVTQDYVNEPPRRKEFIILQNQVLTAEQVVSDAFPPEKTSVFRMPDGAGGLILWNSAQVDPYGWGPCGTCVSLTTSFVKVSPRGRQDILFIQQTDGPEAYCQVREMVFEDYYLSRVDWIRDGQVVVLLLQHRYLDKIKRVKASWAKDGTGVQVILVD